MTQSIVVQVGQCGNQVGCRFWDLALREHAATNRKGQFDEALGTFFRNVDTRCNPPAEIPVGDGRRPIASLKARAVLVDMEEGVVNEILKGPLGDVFDSRQLITSVSGSGNNWACGYEQYGRRYREQILEAVRKAAEACDCLQSFLLVHSMGGGTGSGLGTYICEMLSDEFPEVYRFVTSVYPSEDDDVVTSPYNSVLAMNQLTCFADCVTPVENQALIDICARINPPSAAAASAAAAAAAAGAAAAAAAGAAGGGRGGGKMIKEKSAITDGSGGVQSEKKPFDNMNNIVANMMLNMTCSARFEGSLNIDINEITMNLVPFPKMHYLVPSLTPLYSLADVRIPPRR